VNSFGMIVPVATNVRQPPTQDLLDPGSMSASFGYTRTCPPAAKPDKLQGIVRDSGAKEAGLAPATSALSLIACPSMGRIAIAAIVQLAQIFRFFLMAMAKAAEIAHFTWGNPPLPLFRAFLQSVLAMEHRRPASRGKTKPMKSGQKTPAIIYLRTSSATNVGADKDSERRQHTAVEGFARANGYESEKSSMTPQ
jgi:hypothetical protein